MRHLPLLVLLAVTTLPTRSVAVEPPVVPIGLDAYRQWERWPYQRIGVRAYMRSTYDRSGGNDAADAGHFLYQLADDFNVTLDVEGPGVLYFARYNHWHGSPWHYEVDGTDHIVQETHTANPNDPSIVRVTGYMARDALPNSAPLEIPTKATFIPENLFPAPLAWTWPIASGADLMGVPIPFERRFRMAYSRSFYGTGYYIYHQFLRGIPTSQPLVAWDGKTPPGQDVLDLIKRAGSDLVPRPNTREGDQAGIDGRSGRLDLAPGGAVPLIEVRAGPSTLRALELSIPRNQAESLEGARLRITWDDRSQPSVDVPVPLFFGAGTLYNRHEREYLVKGFPVHIRFAGDRIHLACFFPMPFFKAARIELLGHPDMGLSDVRWSARWAPFRDPANQVGYFHATYKDHLSPLAGHDLVLLDTRSIEGAAEWSGQFIGTSFIFSHNAVLNTLEGDPRFFFDDSNTPQAQGTGTEEWGGGGGYWGGRTTTLPFVGHPVGAPNLKSVQNARDKIESAYRFLLADLMPFGKNAVICLEHGRENLGKERYQTVTLWYGLPAASLIKTDTLQIGDVASEAAHDYSSPEASAPVQIKSRYELGADTFSKGDKREIYPAHTDVGRTTTTASEFTLRLQPNNLGVMLRRKLDYQYPNQRAEVFVADDSRQPVWQSAGIWYLAGANTCVASHPHDQLGKTEHDVMTSNRRFRDDEFLLPRDLTASKESIRVRVKFTPVETPLFPGHPLATLAWSEIRYDAYCFVMPNFRVD